MSTGTSTGTNTAGSAAVTTAAPICAIPQQVAARLLRNFEEFLNSIRDALKSENTAQPQSTRWSRIVSLLERDLRATQAAARLSAGGSHHALMDHASQLRFLARRMDGCDLNFAGPSAAQQLESKRRLLVLVAWQVYAAGSGSGSSGV